MKKLSICLLALLFTLCGQAAFAAVPLDTPVVEADIMPAPMDMDIATPSADMSAELAKVTQSVKTTLDIGDEYTEFYGNQSSDRLFVSWDLYWSNDAEQLNVTADGKGRVISYNRYNNQGYRYNYYGEFAPIFPKQGRDDALAIAKAFLAKVLDKNEQMIFDDLKTAPQPVRTEQNYYFYGSLKANDLPTPLYISISVDMDNMRVSSFNREVMERQYLGGLPGSVPKVSVAQAAPKLAQTVDVEAAYYLDDTGKTARLQYRPIRRGTTGVSIEAQMSFYADSRSVFYVDALTGELIDMEKLYKEAQEAADDFYGNTRANAPAMAMAEDAKAMGGGGDGGSAPRPLTEAELAGTAEQSGLLTPKDMDAKLRAITELDLNGNYKLSRINYRRDSIKSVYYAYMSYFSEADAKSLGLSEADLKKLKDSGNKYYIYKDFTLDAKTGEIRSISTYGSYVDPAITTLKQGEFSQQAKDFLAKYYGEYYKESKPGGGWSYGISDDDAHNFYFSRQMNGYSFPENSLRVRVNAYTGVIEEFSITWDKELTFAPADKIISAEQAKQAYLATLECKLLYRPLPVAIDHSKPEFEPYISYGIAYLYRMSLVYGYEPTSAGAAYGVDAISGEALYYTTNQRQLFEYDDIAGHEAEGKIKDLAAFGVGFSGGKFMPAAKLTELDMLIFFVSAQGNSYDPAELTEEKIEAIYREAYYMGILEQGHEVKPQREISRGEYLKTIIRMSGYGKTALIPSIYNGDFTDAEDIPAELYGYMTIAQGLGLVGRGGSLKPAQIIGRAEAAVILHNFMSREY